MALRLEICSLKPMDIRRKGADAFMKSEVMWSYQREVL